MNPLRPPQYQRPEQLIVHLSDPHFTAARAPMFGLVDSDEILAQTLRQIAGADDAYARGVDLDGLRLVVLDSTVPGFHYGALGDEQLAWLTSSFAIRRDSRRWLSHRVRGHGRAGAADHPNSETTRSGPGILLAGK